MSGEFFARPLRGHKTPDSFCSLLCVCAVFSLSHPLIRVPSLVYIFGNCEIREQYRGHFGVPNIVQCECRMYSVS